MSPNLKLKLKGGFIAGGIYALVMAGFDYFDNVDFRFWYFLFNFFFFGLFMGWSTNSNNIQKVNEKKLKMISHEPK